MYNQKYECFPYNQSMYEIVADRIREIRRENRLSQSEFGEELYVSQDTVSLWENGKSLPTTEMVIEISKKFGVTSDYILGLSEF